MSMDLCDLVIHLRAYFFPKDRDVILQTNRVFTGQGAMPIGGVIFWPSTAGAIPTGWAVFAALQGRFPVGADGATFVNGASGGAETINIRHDHDVDAGTTANDSHDHTVDAGTTAGDTHSHTEGTLATIATLTVTDCTGGTRTIPAEPHTHAVVGSVADDTHSHGPGTLETDSDTHSHGPGTLDTDHQLSATQSIIPPYHCGQWIQRTS